MHGNSFLISCERMNALTKIIYENHKRKLYKKIKIAILDEIFGDFFTF